jgi:predicted alpha-1,6-mannanase (GH76 family)
VRTAPELELPRKVERMGSRPPAPAPRAARGGPHAERADAAFRDFRGAYYVEAAGRGFFTLDRGSRRLASFWTSAELIELAEDRFEGSGDPAARHMVDALLRGFVLRYGRAWTRHNAFNDDVIWAVLAALRAYRITGDPAHRELARTNFDATYARAWSGDLGGGLWWTTGRREKNACVNAPAAIAAGLLFECVRDPAYLARSRRLYAWMREHLFEPDSGRVDDHVTRTDGAAAEGDAGIVDRHAFTYNQGTFIGAADVLHRITGDVAYLADAVEALAFAARELSPGGILRGEGGDGDGGGFKGIFARHAVGFARRNGIGDYDDWFERNAQAAWDRRDARGLMRQDWVAPADAWRPATQCGSDAREPAAWDASSAVVLLEALAAPRT